MIPTPIDWISLGDIIYTVLGNLWEIESGCLHLGSVSADQFCESTWLSVL